jgi:hypothetical protein
MKTPRLFPAIALAVAASAASAQEATQFPLEPSTLTRAEVKAELARARAAGEPINGDQADWHGNRTFARADTKAMPVARSRTEVRTEALAAARTNVFDSRYVGG